MLRKTIIIYSSFVCLVTFFAVSFDVTETEIECGPFKDRFRVTGFDSGIRSIISWDTTRVDFELGSVKKDTVSNDEIALNMIPVPEYYYSDSRTAGNLDVSLTTPAF